MPDSLPIQKINVEISIRASADNVVTISEAETIEFTIKQKLKENAIRYIRRMNQELISLPNDSTVKIDGGWYSHGMLCGAIAILKFEHGINDGELCEVDLK